MTYLLQKTIDYTALEHNIRNLKSFVHVPIYPVIKADSYGLKNKYVVPILYRHGLKKYFVATTEEALDVKSIVDDCIIYVLESILQDDLSIYLQHSNIIPVLNSAKDITFWIEKGNGHLSILHIDTGIHRLGLQKFEYNVILKNPEIIKKANIQLIMSHLASTEESILKTQLDRFNTIVESYPHIPYSLLSTDGLNLSKEYLRDGVRIGKGFLSINQASFPRTKSMLSVKAKLLHISMLQSGEGIGYDGSFVTKKPMIVGTVAIGYGDGLPYLQSKGKFYYKDQPMPVLGKISMDMTTVDLTNVSRKPKIGDWVEVVGEHVTLGDWQRTLDQIGSNIGMSLLHNIDVRTEIIRIF